MVWCRAVVSATATKQKIISASIISHNTKPRERFERAFGKKDALIALASDCRVFTIKRIVGFSILRLTHFVYDSSF
jgi:hypothetical protein